MADVQEDANIKDIRNFIGEYGILDISKIDDAKKYALLKGHYRPP